MKRLINLSVILVTVFFFTSAVTAQTQTGNQSGLKNNGVNKTQSQWVDANGDGICDNFGTANQGSGKAMRGSGKMNKNNGQGAGQGLGKGLGDGSGIRPQDGTGFGRGNGSGTGVCDGTGPKGSGKRGGK